MYLRVLVNVTLSLLVFQVTAEIQLDVMLVKGNYTLTSFFTSTNGPFTISLKNVVAKGNATVGVERDGKVRTEDIVMDLNFSDMTMDFQNLGMTVNELSFISNCAHLIRPLLFDRIHGQHFPIVRQQCTESFVRHNETVYAEGCPHQIENRNRYKC